jgi:hypothetical protein
MQYLCRQKTWTSLHRTGTGPSTTNDTSGDKQSKMTRHECGRMFYLPEFNLSEKRYSPHTKPSFRGEGNHWRQDRKLPQVRYS